MTTKEIEQKKETYKVSANIVKALGFTVCLGQSVVLGGLTGLIYGTFKNSRHPVMAGLSLIGGASSIVIPIKLCNDIFVGADEGYEELISKLCEEETVEEETVDGESTESGEEGEK